jgi:hypothetical protein
MECQVSARTVCTKLHKQWVYVTFEVFMAVTMKNAVFWDIKTQFVPHKKHITASPAKPNRLMLCMVLGFHVCDDEECTLL